MALVVISGKNSYLTEAEADAYLESSVRAATLWAATAAESKRSALMSAFRMLERLRWLGSKTGVLQVTAAALAAGGTGYTANDLLSLVGGTGQVVAEIKVLTVAGGVISTFALFRTGFYTATPGAGPLAVVGGTGNGATFTVTVASQIIQWPRTDVYEVDGTTVIDDDTIPQVVLDAQAELAFELTQNPALESPTDATNTRRVKAGSAEVEFFRPQISQRLPTAVNELIGFLLGTNAGPSAPYASGTDAESSFEDADAPGLNEGFA